MKLNTSESTAKQKTAIVLAFAATYGFFLKLLFF